MMGFPGDSVAKYFPDNAGDVSWIPQLEKSLGEESGTPLQCSCLGNPMDRGAWQVYGVAESDMTEQLSHA